MTRNDIKKKNTFYQKQLRRWRGTSITKTRLFKYIENFTTKNGKFSDKDSDVFFFFFFFFFFSNFCSKYRTEAVLTSTYNLCFWAEISKNNEYPCKPKFYYIKVRFKGSKLYRYVFVMNRNTALERSTVKVESLNFSMSVTGLIVVLCGFCVPASGRNWALCFVSS